MLKCIEGMRTCDRSHQPTHTPSPLPPFLRPHGPFPCQSYGIPCASDGTMLPRPSEEGLRSEPQGSVGGVRGKFLRTFGVSGLVGPVNCCFQGDDRIRWNSLNTELYSCYSLFEPRRRLRTSLAVSFSFSRFILLTLSFLISRTLSKSIKNSSPFDDLYFRPPSLPLPTTLY